MTQKIFKEKTENSKHVQVRKSAICISAVMDECAGCGKDSPEYVLEDRQLCLDCYRAEILYWAKGDAPNI